MISSTGFNPQAVLRAASPARALLAHASAPPSQAASPTQAPPTPPDPSPAPLAQGSRLRTNPLFRDGVPLDEFQVDAGNVDFAIKRFGIDPAFADLARTSPPNVRLSVLYHSAGRGHASIDAYRAAAVAGKSVFAVYKAADPAFDPQQVYKNELVTNLGNGTLFSTEVVSPRLAVPSSAGADVTQWLQDNDFARKESVAFGDLKYPSAFGAFFGVDDKLSIDMYDAKKQSFSDRFKIFAQLCKSSPEFAFVEAGNVANNVGAAMLLGVLTPELWKQGTLYGIAGTISSIDNIASPAVGILGEGMLGHVVDKAVNSDHPVENLKKVSLGVASASAVQIGCAAALHPAILGAIGGGHPGGVFLGLYGAQTIIGALTGGISGRVSEAVYDELINKNAPPDADYARSFFQILGVESSISRGLYLGAYSAAVAAATAMPALSLPIALTGAGLWAASGFVWPLYTQKPEVKTVIEGKGYAHDGDRYTFDSGWEVEFRGSKGRIVREDASHFSVSIDDGALCIRKEDAGDVKVTHKRRLKDYLPKFLKPRFTGEKERWDLEDGGRHVTVSRNGSSGYAVKETAPGEFLLSRGDNPFQKAPAPAP